MKSLIAAAMLLALTVPAAAFDNTFYWDCGGGAKISLGDDMTIKAELLKGSVKWDFRGRGRDFKVWLNGKACTRIFEEK